MIFNMVRGSSNTIYTDALAFITVIYPVGAICTCTEVNDSTKNSRVYKADNTGGLWIFPIPKVGQWKITANLDGKVIYKIIDIVSANQFVRAVLGFTKSILVIDNAYGGTAKGWVSVGEDGTTPFGVMSGSGNALGYSSNSVSKRGAIMYHQPIDATGYNYICAKCRAPISSLDERFGITSELKCDDASFIGWEPMVDIRPSNAGGDSDVIPPSSYPSGSSPSVPELKLQTIRIPLNGLTSFYVAFTDKTASGKYIDVYECWLEV